MSEILLGERGKELTRWLEVRLNYHNFLQATHPHLAYFPTAQDVENLAEIKSLIENMDEKVRVSRENIHRAIGQTANDVISHMNATDDVIKILREADMEVSDE